MDVATVDLLTRVIGNLGFPIFVAVWLLLRTDKLLGEVRDLVKELLIVLRSTTSDSEVPR